MTQPTGTEGQGQQPAQGAGQQPQAQQQQPTPPWGDTSNFDAEKAWKLIEDLRADKEKLSARTVLDDATKAKLAEFDKIKAASQTELEKAQGEATRWQTESERWRTAAVSSSIRAHAAADFEYPEDAVAQLDASKYLDAGGTIDERAIKGDLDKLLEKRPNWRRGSGEEPTGPRTPRPNQAQGSGINGKSAPDPAQEFAAIMQSHL